MKTIFCCFDYVYVKFDADTDVDNCILSDKQDDCMFFVCDHNTTEEQLHKYEKSLYEQCNIDTYELSCDFKIAQQRYYSDAAMQQEYNKRQISLLQEFMTLDTSDYTKYLY